ncbi:MAG: pilus assembly protein PilM [Planctomycetota bacterium]|nr:pilus assembly protein PilM [Planctomycetota bacterium]
MTARNEIVIDLGRRRLQAVQVARSRNGLRVKRALVEAVPDGLYIDEAKAYGAWAGLQLAKAGFPRTKATIEIAREHVALKRLSLPTSEQSELPEMTRLALRRNLPFDDDHAVIDFVTVDRTTSSTTVLAVAVPQTVLTHVQQIAKGAGLRVERIALRSMGSAALLGSLAESSDGIGAGGVLVVDIAADAVEFIVVVDGVIRFSRAAQLPPLDDPARLADAVVTEARRTWMSYRIVEAEDADSDVRRAVVMGNLQVSEQAARLIGDMLKVQAEVLKEHPLVDLVGQDMDSMWPLAGLLLEQNLGVESIDFARPRKAPDVSARKRQRILAAVGLVIVLIVGGWTLARRNLATLSDTVAKLEARSDSLRPLYARYGRDLYKLAHLKQWEAVDANWLDHLAYIVDIAPPTQDLVLDSWTGSLTSRGVKFDRKAKRWHVEPQMTIVLQGEAADRATADAFRGALVDAEAYQITTAGPDARSGRRLSYAFSYHLRTTAGEPVAAGPSDRQRADVQSTTIPAPRRTALTERTQ